MKAVCRARCFGDVSRHSVPTELQLSKTGDIWRHLAGATVDAKERGRLKWLGIRLRLVIVMSRQKIRDCHLQYWAFVSVPTILPYFTYLYQDIPRDKRLISSAWVGAVGEVTSLEFVLVQVKVGALNRYHGYQIWSFWSHPIRLTIYEIWSWGNFATLFLFLRVYTPVYPVPFEACNSMATPTLRWRCLNKLHTQHTHQIHCQNAVRICAPKK